MLYYKNNRWHVSDLKVRYIQNNKESENMVGQEGKQWWLDFEDKWDHTEIVEFIPIEFTEMQLARFEGILELNVPEGFHTELGEYVESGTFPEGFNHILRPLEIFKENTKLGTELSEREIQEIIQGQQISELEIMMLGGV